jgi:thiol-disulfide isomerase/thioredoxin
MAKKRVGSPVGVAVVAAVLAALVTTLVLSFVLEDDDTGDAAGPPLTLDPDATGTVPQADVEGQPVPDFTFADIRTGDEQTFDEFRDGRPAMVNFFFRTCAPCIVEMPDLQDAYEAYGDEVAFLGLSYQETAESGLELVERTGVEYEIGRDPDGGIITEFEAPGLPTTVFIAADGTITYSHTRQIRPAQLREQLDRLVT